MSMSKMNNVIKEILDFLKEPFSKGKTHKAINKKETYILLDYITNLQEERDTFKNRCYKSVRFIRDNYGFLDKYEIEMLDDILNGDEDE